MNTTEPTTDELKAAYKRARLWAAGITYQRAIETPLVLRVLRHAATAHAKKHQPPQQARLI